MKGFQIKSNSLQTAVNTYSKDNVYVVVPGMIHVADWEFYSNIQQILDHCEVVLAEGIRPMPPDGYVDPARKQYLQIMDNLTLQYIQMAQYMGMKMQSNVLRMNKKWVSADVSIDYLVNNAPVEFLEKLKSPPDLSDFQQAYQNEPAATSEALRSISLFAMGHPGIVTILSIFKKGISETMKDKITNYLTGGVILDDRNEHLFSVMDQYISPSPYHTVLGVPWGAAHLDGIDRYLRSNGFELEQHVWLEAWKDDPNLDFVDAMAKLGKYMKKEK